MACSSCQKRREALLKVAAKAAKAVKKQALKRKITYRKGK